MKKILTIILILLTTSCYSQMRMHQDEVLENYKISMYKVKTHNYELLQFSDTLLTIFSLDLGTRKVFSIEYIYKDTERLNTSLKTLLKDAIEITEGIYLDDEWLFVIKEFEVQILDVKYIKRYK